MSDKDYRTATTAELQREADRIRRAKQAMDNHIQPGRAHGAKVMDALIHTQTSIKKPDTAGGGYRVSEICRNADDTENNTKSE